MGVLDRREARVGTFARQAACLLEKGVFAWITLLWRFGLVEDIARMISHSRRGMVSPTRIRFRFHLDTLYFSYFRNRNSFSIRPRSQQPTYSFAQIEL